MHLALALPFCCPRCATSISRFTRAGWGNDADDKLLYKKIVNLLERQVVSPFFSTQLATARRSDSIMAKKKKVKELQPKIKVRLDARTIITVRDESKLDFWREKYPNLEVIKDL
jgi:hypothetical protein